MTAIPILEAKHPNATLLYAHDFSGALLWDGEDIADSIHAEDDADETKRPTVEVIRGDAIVEEWSLLDNEIRFMVSGGTKSTWFRLTVHLLSGRVIVDDLVLSIDNSPQ